MTKGRVLAATAAIMVTMFLVQSTHVGIVSAQYPPPNGNLVCTTDVMVSVNNMGQVSATLTDSAGTPVPGVLVTFEIISQPGGASLVDHTVTTDANGVATTKLLTGSNPGNVSISATTESAECRAVTQIKPTVFRPPSTGDAGLAAIDGGLPTGGSIVAAVGGGSYAGTYLWTLGQIIAIAMLGAAAGLIWRRQAEKADLAG